MQYFVGGLIGVLIAVGVIVFFDPFGQVQGVCYCEIHEGASRWLMWPSGEPNPELCPPPGYDGGPCS